MEDAISMLPLRKQGLPVFSALEQALCGHPVFPAF